jgi:hypothetical protein
MRLPRVRFTVRRMMVAVVVVAIGLAGLQAWLLRTRGLRYQQRAQFHAHWEAHWRRGVERLRRGVVKRPDVLPLPSRTGLRYGFQPGSKDLIAEYNGPSMKLDPPIPTDSERLRYIRYKAAVCARWMTFHAKLRQNYERAARYPWLPFEPDPPMPK